MTDSTAVGRLLECHDGPTGPRTRWLAGLEALDPPAEPVILPPGPEMASTLRRLGIPADDVAPTVASVPSPERDPELWWVLERSVALLRADMGGCDEPDPPWADLPSHLGAAARYFWVHVFLAALPAAREYHRAHGISDEISWASLSDLGDKMRMYRRAHGVGGLDKQDWLTLHLRGVLVALGRLQFAVTPFTPELRLPAAVTDLGPVGLGVHIPANGPLDPFAVADSLRIAGDYCAAHLPGPLARVGVCTSWLLDPQLAGYLPASSNIMAFQRMFTPTGDVRVTDADILEFVTGRPDRAVADIGRATTLERAIADHLRAGRRWQVCTGWRLL